MFNKNKVTYILSGTFLLVFILDFFVFLPDKSVIFTVDHLIYGNGYGYLTEYGRLVSYKELGFEIWRLFTSMFLHAGIPHLLVNCLALIILGLNIEKILGSKKFLILFFTAGIVASAVSIFFTDGAVGASGGLYGLAGTYIWLIISKQIKIKNAFSIVSLVIVILYLILPNISSTTVLSAHITGFVVGFIFALCFCRSPQTDSTQK